MIKKQIFTNKAPLPAGPYSQGIFTEDYVFVSGQRPVDANNGQKGKDIKEQTRQVIANMQNILAEAGSSLADVVKVTVYLSDISYFEEMNEVYTQLMPEPFPTRTTIGAQLRGIDIEMNAIALRNGEK